MKVLQVSKFYKPVMGGIEKVAWELAEGMARRGLRCDVLCSSHAPRTSCERFNGGYDVVRAASYGMLLSTSMAPALAIELQRRAASCDLLHLHMPDPMAALALLWARPRVPVVVHWHSDVIRQRRAMRLYQPLQDWLLKRADAIIATSLPYADASLPLRRYRGKVEVIPIGISDSLAQGDRHSDAAAALRHRFGGRRIVFALGRMAYYKGFEVLVRAAAQLPEDAVVLIGGDGEMLATHQTLVRELGLTHKVHLCGHVQDGELPAYFQACDVFCMSSTVRAEAYGVAMLEAMMMGKPIVATDIPGSGVPWVNQHGITGYNVPVGRDDLLATALSQLLARPQLRHAMGSAARARYLRGFGADEMTQRVARLYDRLCAVRSSNLLVPT